MIVRVVVATAMLAAATILVAAPEPRCLIARGPNGEVKNLALEGIDAAQPEIGQKLGKGLAVTMVHDLYDGGRLVTSFGCKVFFDLWDEAYGVTPHGTTSQRQVKSKSAMFELCFTLDSTKAKTLRLGSDIDVVVHIDPVSDDQAAKTRQWLADRGIASGSGPILGRAVGAMINLKKQRTQTIPCTSVRSGGGR